MKYIYILAIVFCNKLHSQSHNSLRLGIQLTSAGNRTSHIVKDEHDGSPYIGAGPTIEYCYVRKDIDSLDSTPRVKDKLYISYGIRVNYTRYGISMYYSFPMLHSVNATIEHFNISLMQELNYRVTSNMTLGFQILEGLKNPVVKGDAFIKEVYGLEKAGKNNLTKYSLDIGIGAYFRIKPKFYVNLGYVNGLLNNIKTDRYNHPILREYYPYIRLIQNF